MKFLSHRRGDEQHANLVADIENAFLESSVLQNADFGKIAYDTESMKAMSFADQADGAEEIEQFLQNADLENFLSKHAKVDQAAEGPEKDLAIANVARGMEAAVATAVALINPKQYQANFVNAKPQAMEGVKVIESTVPGQASSYSLDMEGFDNFKFENFRASAIISNALNAMTNSFEDTFFKPVMISPAEQGADVLIRIPYVFNSKQRSNNGDAFEPEHKLVIDAYRDRTILANTGNKAVPNVAVIDANYVADPADVPNRQFVLNSTTVDSRPLVFGQNVDMLGGSGHAGLPGATTQTEQDTLSPTADLGDLYVKVSHGVDSVVAIIDTRPLTGSLFLPGQVGDNQQLVLNMDAIANIKSTTITADNSTAIDVAGINGDLGQAVTDEWTVAIQVKLAGQFWPRRGNIEVNTQSATPVQIVKAFDKDGNEATAAQVAALQGNVTLELIGYLPSLTRTNSNLRDKGMGVDLGSTTKYRLAVPILSPITAAQPVNLEGGAVGMDGLQMVRRARNNNISVQTLFDYEDVIRSCNGQKTQHAGIGSHLITPTLIEDTIDLGNKVVFIRSKGSRDDVREAIGAAIDQVASEMLEKSGYLAVLDALYGTTAGFEFIIATSPRIHSLLMTSGDARLMGANRRFTIVSNHDDDFIDQIYISVRRPGETSVDPLSFGAHVSLPPLVYKAPVTMRDNGSHSIETQLLSRDLFVGTCPLMGKITVSGLNELFTD